MRLMPIYKGDWVHGVYIKEYRLIRWADEELRPYKGSNAHPNPLNKVNIGNTAPKHWIR